MMCASLSSRRCTALGLSTKGAWGIRSPTLTSTSKEIDTQGRIVKSCSVARVYRSKYDN